jgi:hypothetical protein
MRVSNCLVVINQLIIRTDLGERRHLYRFCGTVARLGLNLALHFGGNQDKCRAAVLYCAFFGGYDGVHYSSNGPRLADAAKYGYASGDRYIVNISLVVIID